MNSKFVDNLLDFNYDFRKLDTWIKLMCQVTFGVSVVILLQSLDGEGCSRGWYLWSPSTWVRPPACTIRGIIRNIDPGFEQPDKTETIETPPP